MTIAPKKPRPKPRRKYYERAGISLRINTEEARVIRAALATLCKRAAAEGLDPPAKSDLYRAAILDWAQWALDKSSPLTVATIYAALAESETLRDK